METVTPAVRVKRRDFADRRSGDRRDGLTSGELYRRIEDKLAEIESERRHSFERREGDRRRVSR
jgi:hypothetical protein